MRNTVYRYCGKTTAKEEWEELSTASSKINLQRAAGEGRRIHFEGMKGGGGETTKRKSEKGI